MQEAESENQQGEDEIYFLVRKSLKVDVLQVFNPSDVIKYIIVEDWF